MEQFKSDVLKGLSANPKFVSSKYFYDKTGDALFVEIMNMPEYYLTQAELEIFEQQTNEIIKSFDVQPGNYFELIELGAGDGFKTKHLLKALIDQNYVFDYFPIDISPNILIQLESTLKHELPNCSVKPTQGDFLEMLSKFKDSNHKKVILFLGSNLGNLNDELAAKFVYDLGCNLRPNDCVLLGVDLIKSEEIVLPAYNDASGITAKFNLNLLDRINSELGGNFETANFKHHAEYDIEEGVAKSFLVSKVDQTVAVDSLNTSFSFAKGEKIHTEISRKYNDVILNKILSKTDFKITHKLTDGRGFFADVLLKRV